MSHQESESFLRTSHNDSNSIQSQLDNRSTTNIKLRCNWKLLSVAITIILIIIIWLILTKKNQSTNISINTNKIIDNIVNAAHFHNIIKAWDQPTIPNMLNNVTVKKPNNFETEKNKNNHHQNINNVQSQQPIQHNINNEDVLFEWNVLEIDNNKHKDLNILKTDITSLLINETLTEKKQNKSYYGPHSFHIKYPKLDTDEYKTNEIRKFCFYFKLNDNNYKINAAQIDITFNEFKLESGFDRIIIRHFNSSYIDPPISFVGKPYKFDTNKYPNSYKELLDKMHQKYFLYKKEAKTICVELQSDDYIVDKGFDFIVSIRYDLCQWTQWEQCKTLYLVDVKWSRGPMNNGKCGVGVTSKHRISQNDTIITSDTENIAKNGYIDCTKESEVNGPEFCIKAPCSNYDLLKDPDFPPKKMPGWAWYNYSRYYNGVGRYDPVYPDPFRLYLSENMHSSFSDISNTINKLLEALKVKMKNISDDHYHPNVLKYGVLDPKHKEKTAEFLGARVIDSLLIGRPFIVDLTGDSVTSGHDNMQESTYAMQTQSRLRNFFVEHGVKQSSFQVRNIAEGGGVSTNTQGFMPIPMSTENYDYFSGVYKRINDETDYENENVLTYDNENEYRYMTAGYPIRNIDILLWEFHFTDGHATDADREVHLREGVLLNAIWGIMGAIGGIRVSESCQDWDKLLREMSDWTKLEPKWGFPHIMPAYVNADALGTVFIDPNYGMHGACNILLNGTVVSDQRYGDNGQLYPGQMYGYTSYWLKTNWHPNTRGHRVMADILAYWILESAYNFLSKYKADMAKLNNYKELYRFLKNKSGDWKDKMLKSMINKDNSFMDPIFCGGANGKCKSVPFGVTSFRPQTFNTHFRMQDFIMNDVPFDKVFSDLGFREVNSDNIVSMEDKTGGPGNMDSKFLWRYNHDFYQKLYRTQYAEYAKLSKNINTNQVTREEKDKFERYLIENKIYLQFKVLVPKNGNGTVELFNAYGCDPKVEVKEHVRLYIAEINEEDIGQRMGNLTQSKCKWQGLKAGNKYKLSVVPYNIHEGKGDNEWVFGVILAY